MSEDVERDSDEPTASEGFPHGGDGGSAAISPEDEAVLATLPSERRTQLALFQHHRHQLETTPRNPERQPTPEDLYGQGNRSDQVTTHVNIHIPVDTLLRINDGQASLDGYGDVPTEMVDYLLSQPGTTVRTVLCDPGTGRPVALGTTAKTFSGTSKELARIRDRECIAPGCHAKPDRCDVDHNRPKHTGGDSTPANATLLCRFHNRTIKNLPGWHLSVNIHSGQITITTPTGDTYTHTPDAILTTLPKPQPKQAGPNTTEVDQ